MMRNRISAVSISLLAAIAPLTPSAQDGPLYLEEVLVVAMKREQTLQEVPVAVSVVNAQQIEQAQVHDIKDLQTLVPSLRVTQLQTSANTNFIIRGFGNGANNAGIEPSVGVFIDGVYRSRVGSSLADLPKLERVEVLRGPQSTLFGKNASAGIINIVTAKPDFLGYSGSASLTAGNESQFIVKGDVTGPLSDTVAFSLSGSVNQRDGYYENELPGDNLNEINRWNIRGQLLFAPSDRLEIRLIGDVEQLDEACCGVANLQDGPTGAVVRLLGGDLVSNDPFAYRGFYDFTPTNDIEATGISAEVIYDWDEVTLTSISSLRNLSQLQNADIDFTGARLVSSNFSDTEIDTFTQEIRLTSAGDGSLAWMLGLFYFSEDVEIDGNVFYGDQFRPYADILAGGGISALEAALGAFNPAITPGTLFGNGQGHIENATQDDETISLFAQIDWDLSDRATLTLGANYTEVEKDTSATFISTDVFSSLDLTQIGFGQLFSALTGGLPPIPAVIAANPAAAATAQALSVVPCSATTGPACNPLLALTPFQFLPPFLNFPNAVESGKSNDDDITWTVRLSYEINHSMNIYVGASTGFKATSWNLSRDSRPFPSDVAALNAAGIAPPNLTPGTRFAGPEESTVFEIGLKAEFEQIAFNFAVFDQEIDGFQSNIFTGTGFSLANAGKQSARGAEFDMTWMPVESLRIGFAATWLDPQYDSFEGAEGVDGPTDLSGTTPPGIHEFSANTSATYSFDLGASGSGFVRAEYIYEDEVQVIENVPASVASREVSMVNASIGLSWENGFEASLWGRNLTDDEFLQSAFPSVAQDGSYSGYPNPPRSYGLTIRKIFE